MGSSNSCAIPSVTVTDVHRHGRIATWVWVHMDAHPDRHYVALVYLEPGETPGCTITRDTSYTSNLQGLRVRVNATFGRRPIVRPSNAPILYPALKAAAIKAATELLNQSEAA